MTNGSRECSRGGKMLRKARMAREWTQGKASRELKVPQSRLSAYERGYTPGLRHAVVFQKELGIPVEAWL